MSQFLCSGGDKKMAESKGSLLAKSVSKHAGRAKEKVSKFLFFGRLLSDVITIIRLYPVVLSNSICQKRN